MHDTNCFKQQKTKHFKTPVELGSPKNFPLKYLYNEVNFQASMQYFPGSIIKANYVYISLVNYKL